MNTETVTSFRVRATIEIGKEIEASGSDFVAAFGFDLDGLDGDFGLTSEAVQFEGSFVFYVEAETEYGAKLEAEEQLRRIASQTFDSNGVTFFVDSCRIDGVEEES